MEYTIDTTIKQRIKLDAAGLEEIMQNIRMIASTPAYSCPMNRDFAWIPEMLDGPIHTVQAQIRGRLAEAIQKYEPRATVTRIDFKTDALNGTIKPVVRVMIDEAAL